jgi:hypothetical protein
MMELAWHLKYDMVDLMMMKRYGNHQDSVETQITAATDNVFSSLLETKYSVT